MLNNFIYAQTKDLFLEALGTGNILDEAIVFIEDTKEIWNHGHYFAGEHIDPEIISNLSTVVARLESEKVDENTVDAKIAALVDSAPSTLDTLNELAAALGDDPNFATTVATNIGKKADQTELANYLPKTGGTLTGSTADLLTITRTSGNPKILFKSADTTLGYLGVSADKGPTFTTHEGTEYALIHSNNASSLTVANASALDGKTLFTGWSGIANVIGGVMEIGRYIDFRCSEGLSVDYTTRLAAPITVTPNNVKLPSKSGTLALTTDNVASATKLQTARSLWGQSFDGTADVNGDLISTGKIVGQTGVFDTSDETLKDFLGDITIDFDAIKSIPKKYFTWKDGDGKVEIGTGAQSLQKIYPELVEESNGTLVVAYNKLAIVALAAIDKLNDEKKALEERVEKLEKLVEKLV